MFTVRWLQVQMSIEIYVCIYICICVHMYIHVYVDAAHRHASFAQSLVDGGHFHAYM